MSKGSVELGLSSKSGDGKKIVCPTLISGDCDLNNSKTLFELKRIFELAGIDIIMKELLANS